MLASVLFFVVATVIVAVFAFINAVVAAVAVVAVTSLFFSGVAWCISCSSLIVAIVLHRCCCPCRCYCQ